MDLDSIDHVLTTTRSVRKRLDLQRPVEREVIERCLDIAVQAPSGSDRQPWQLVMVIDSQLKAGLAELYRRSFEQYRPAQSTAADRRLDSAMYLAEHMHEVPLLALFCYQGRVEGSSIAAQAALYGSILPAAWSFMLALRARGLGSAWTTLHLRYEREAAALLDLPPGLTQAALLPVAYYTGDDFRSALRTPASEVTLWK